MRIRFYKFSREFEIESVIDLIIEFVEKHDHESMINSYCFRLQSRLISARCLSDQPLVHPTGTRAAVGGYDVTDSLRSQANEDCEINEIQ